MRFKKALPIGGLLALSMLGLWYAYRDEPDARVVGDLPKGMSFVARSAASPPIIDWNVFGYPIVFPSRNRSVGKFRDLPRPSGFVTWSSALTFGPWPEASFSQAVWIHQQEEHRTWSESEEGLWSATSGILPRVFGNQPKLFHVVWTDHGDLPVSLMIRKFSVEVPGTRTPAPTLPEVTAQFARFRLRFTPIDWIGPGFRPRYQVHLDGAGPNDVFFFDYDNGFFREAMRHSNARPAMFHLRPQEAKVVMNIAHVLPSTRSITFKQSGSSTSFSLGREVLAKGQGGKGGTEYHSVSKRFLTFRLNYSWVDLDYGNSSNVGDIFQSGLDRFAYEHGESYTAEVYELLARDSISLDFKIPSRFLEKR